MLKASKIYLVSDHVMLSNQILACLRSRTEFKLVGQSNELRASILPLKKLKPQLLLLDSGLALGQNVNLPYLSTLVKRIIIFETSSSIKDIYYWVKSGVNGYVTRRASIEDLLFAIREVMEGRNYFNDEVSSQLLNDFLATAGKERQTEQYHLLSEREREIFQLVIKGMSSKEVAGVLFISPRTVDKHRSNIMSKLGVKNKLELVKYAAHMGLL